MARGNEMEEKIPSRPDHRGRIPHPARNKTIDPELCNDGQSIECRYLDPGENELMVSYSRRQCRECLFHIPAFDQYHGLHRKLHFQHSLLDIFGRVEKGERILSSEGWHVNVPTACALFPRKFTTQLLRTPLKCKTVERNALRLHFAKI